MLRGRPDRLDHPGHYRPLERRSGTYAAAATAWCPKVVFFARSASRDGQNQRSSWRGDLGDRARCSPAARRAGMTPADSTWKVPAPAGIDESARSRQLGSSPGSTTLGDLRTRIAFGVRAARQGGSFGARAGSCAVSRTVPGGNEGGPTASTTFTCWRKSTGLDDDLEEDETPRGAYRRHQGLRLDSTDRLLRPQFARGDFNGVSGRSFRPMRDAYSRQPRPSYRGRLGVLTVPAVPALAMTSRLGHVIGCGGVQDSAEFRQLAALDLWFLNGRAGILAPRWSGERERSVAANHRRPDVKRWE